jgi:FkbH-like protein
MTEPLSLASAMAVVNGARGVRTTRTARVGLACSFTPLHLQTFLHACLINSRPDTAFTIETGLFGDLPGTLQTFAESGLDACFVVIEWPDLDPRLSPRSPAGVVLDDLADTSRQRIARLADQIATLSVSSDVVVSLPATSLPATVTARSGQLSPAEAAVRADVAALAARLSAVPNVRVLAPGNGVDAHDLRNDLRSGLPYVPRFSSGLARSAVAVLFPPAAKKGLVTDLDDTLWRGLVGEVGADALTWDLDSGSQVHAMYQQLLADLARRGVLLAVASKNDPEVAAAGLARADLHVDQSRFFPVEVSWHPKSQAVARILEAWNIGAGDVVFVDDSPMELGEVQEAFPDITVLQFEGGSPDSVSRLLADLRDLFWRDGAATEEDALRLDSLRARSALEDARSGNQDEDAFLRSLSAEIVIDTGGGWREPRARELVQKTNQFNLNGLRRDEAEWQRLAERPGAVMATIAYTDKFGPLGTVSALTGVVSGNRLTVDTWVLSCRAFSRAIEFHVLDELARAYDVGEIAFEYAPTDRNHMVGELLASFGDDVAQGGALAAEHLHAHPRARIHAVRHDERTTRVDQ